MKASEFQLHFRFQREVFFALCGQLQDSPSFACVTVTIKKASVEHHLLCLLKILGSSGNGTSTDMFADFFSQGKGTGNLLVSRSVAAIEAIQKDVIVWPQAQEQREIAQLIGSASGFSQCIELIDGTLFPFETKPTLCREDYYSRKASYAPNGLIVCDDRARVRYMNASWSGSSHDNRVWKNCKVYHDRTSHFFPSQFLLGDSAFQPSDVMLPAYKKYRNAALSLE